MLPIVPTEVLADAGYRDEATLATLDARAITAYVSLGREGKATPVLDPTHEATRRIHGVLDSIVGGLASEYARHAVLLTRS
jgi:hypothetical protein